MTPVREAIVLPLIFMTATLLGGLDPGAARPWRAPSLFSLVLAVMLTGVLVRSGALAPDRLLHSSRSMLANSNGFIVLLSLLAASAQVLHMLTPRSGVPALIVGLVLFLLLLNTWVVRPLRPQLMRSLAVILGSAFVLKFVLLGALADPDGGRTKRVVVALFDLATLGVISQDPLHPSAGYLAFLVVLLYVIGLALLPARMPGTDISLSPMKTLTRASLLLLCMFASLPALASAQSATHPFGTLREQSSMQHEWLKKRVDTFLPELMRRHRF